MNLRKVLARQPGSETAEQLRLYAATLREKQGKHKQMSNELKMYQARVYEYKYELQKLDSDMKLVKLEYFNRRRAELAQQQKQMQRERYEEEAGMEAEDEEDDIGTYQGVPPTLSSTDAEGGGNGEGGENQ